MTQAVAFSAEADGNARRPRFNTDPASMFGGGITPAGRRSIASLYVTTKIGNVTNDSATVTIADTSGINIGDVVLGAGVSATEAVTTTDADDLFVLATHGIPDGSPVFLVSIATTTGITAGRQYYKIAGTTAGNFKLALTPGGSAIALTTNGTAVIRATRFVAAITEDTSVTLSAIASASAAATPLEFVSLPILA